MLILSVKVTFEEIVLISLSLLCQSLFDGSGANVTAVRDNCGSEYTERGTPYNGRKGVLPIMAYTGRLRCKGASFSGFRYMKG